MDQTLKEKEQTIDTQANQAEGNYEDAKKNLDNIINKHKSDNTK